jgi:hypothetical protein
MMEEDWRSGGCHCGAIRYEVDANRVFDSGYCHCSICRRLTGAPVVAWALLKPGAFRITAGTPHRYDSSPLCRRSFCPTCGGQLFYMDNPNASEMSGIHTATLDEPAPPALQPCLHMCADNQLAWFRTGDNLPRFADNRLSHPERR